jgi:hypothetical protein
MPRSILCSFSKKYTRSTIFTAFTDSPSNSRCFFKRLRLLRNPHAQQHRTSVLYTINPSGPFDSEEEDQRRIDNIHFGLQKKGPSKFRKPED